MRVSKNRNLKCDGYNHQLIYVKETKDAPSKESFRSTLLHFLNFKHEQHIKSEYERLKIDEKKITRKSLYVETPRPTLELIPLTSEDSIEEFLKKYDILKSIEITLSDRNDENDNDPFFDELQKRKDKIGSKASVVRHTNSQGLNKDNAIQEISEATEQGNQSVKLSGIDIDGDILSGNNEKFQLRKPLENLSSKPNQAAKELYQSFLGLVDDGLVKAPETSPKARKIIGLLMQRLF